MRHVQAQVVNAHLLAANVAIGLVEIDLGMAGSMRRRQEHFLLAGGYTVYVFAHDGVAAGVAVLVM